MEQVEQMEQPDQGREGEFPVKQSQVRQNSLKDSELARPILKIGWHKI